MHTRIAVAALWLFASLYAGSMLHAVMNVPELVGPAIGFVTAAGIVVMPTGRRVPSRAVAVAQERSRLELVRDLA